MAEVRQRRLGSARLGDQLGWRLVGIHPELFLVVLVVPMVEFGLQRSPGRPHGHMGGGLDMVEVGYTSAGMNYRGRKCGDAHAGRKQ